jgi:hypothetical protein
MGVLRTMLSYTVTFVNVESWTMTVLDPDVVENAGVILLVAKVGEISVRARVVSL